MKQKVMAYALMYIFEFLQQEHRRDYVLFTELHGCVGDMLRQIELDKDNEKMMKDTGGTGMLPEKYRELNNNCGTDVYHMHTQAVCE